MQKVSKHIVIQSLEHEWEAYIDQLASFSPAEKQQFLQKQGYETTVDFVVHIVGWWQECMRIIQAVQQDPNYQIGEVDVDGYNRKTIAANRGKSEAEIMQLFKDTHRALKTLIEKLPDSAIENETINSYLFWCVTNHLDEHAIVR